jgi:hypothetical protein
MHQNVTLKLDKELLQNAKIYAVQHKTSLSQMMVTALKSIIEKSETYDKAKRKALGYLKRGFKIGPPPYSSSRDILHDR